MGHDILEAIVDDEPLMEAIDNQKRFLQIKEGVKIPSEQALMDNEVPLSNMSWPDV